MKKIIFYNTGGNCELTKPGEVYVHNGVTVIGYTDFPSRLPTQASTLYANNITKLLLYLLKTGGEKGLSGLDLNDDVVRGSIVLHNGTLLWPPPPPPTPKPDASKAAAATTTTTAPAVPQSKFAETLKSSLVMTTGFGTLLALGIGASDAAFMNMFTIFSLAGIGMYFFNNCLQ